MSRRSNIPPKFDRSNFPYKVNEIKNGGIKPVVKICVRCKKKIVKYHHFLCSSCHEKRYGRK